MRMRFMNNYEVSYVLKEKRKETQMSMSVWAHNAKEAIQQVKETVLNDTGLNAFRPRAVRCSEV